MIVQDIVNSVSTDTRQVLQNSGADANTIMDWIDRIHKDVLHTSLYVNQNLATTSVTTMAGTSSYTLTSNTPIRRIVGVYDSTFNLSLKPADADIDQPSPTQAQVDESQGRPFATAAVRPPHQAYNFGGIPEYYRFLAPSTLLLRPAPPSIAYTSTLSIVYEQLITTLSSLTTPLLIPDDGKDVVVSGVNWLAMAYIGRPQEAASWFQLYRDLKFGNRTGVIR